MNILDHKKDIDKYTQYIKAFRSNKELYHQEKEILQLVKDRYELYHTQIHKYLALQETKEAEQEIQDHIKTLCSYDLPIAESKITLFQASIKAYHKNGDVNNENLCYKYLQDWLDLYEGIYALLAFRSLEHFANFMEWDKKDSEKVWKYSLDPYGDNGHTGVNKPFFYYFNQMVLKKDIKFISKQQSTGSGKSYSNHFAISWLLGVNPDNDILVVLGNPALVMTNIKTVAEIMRNPRYAKVFPIYEKYLETTTDKDGNMVQTMSDNMFETLRNKEGEMKLADSTRPLNLKVISKDTPIDGIRVKYLFLDDVCRSKDAGNMKMHEIDINNYWNSWWKRNYNTDDFYVVVGGTAYSIFDIISTLITYYSKGKMIRTKEFKYAYKSVDEKCVFIKVPKIDEDLNRSTYPQKFSYEEAIKIRDRNYRDFMAMEQQQPLPPENSPFYTDNLQTYEVIPEEGRSEFCWAALDSARVGFDYNSMPIFAKVGDKFYLKDCLYINEPMEKIYQKIIDKIKFHKITKFVIEKNIDTSLKALLNKMLIEQGIFYCEIIEVYSTTKKEEKIYNMETTIKNCIVFPDASLYTYASQMGRFMNDVFSFSYVHKNEHDDSIDSLATFCQKMVVEPTKNRKAKILYV